MKNYLKSFLIMALLASVLVVSARHKISIKEEAVTYTSNGVTLKSFVYYDENKKGKRPAVIVVPEWWGNNEYAKMRAHKLAELGYIAIATDFYGEDKIAADPKEAQELATPFYKDAQLGESRIVAAINKLKEFKQTDENKIAAIGYCFGGSMVLNAATLGTPELKGVVSFHGGLVAVPPATTGSVKSKILVCHGDADKFVPPADVTKFKNNLDSLSVPYTFIAYPNATHAFTNPQSTATGKKFSMPIEYNEAADKKSWNDMKAFFKKLFKTA